jgi:enoyl-CoA hydratase/carnithine racemase
VRREYESDRLAVDGEGCYREVTLLREDKHNAVDRRMRDDLITVLRAFRADDGVQAIGLLGAGPSFCSGGDLREFGMNDPVENYFARTTRNLPGHFDALSDRLVIGVHGDCVGAGLELAAFAKWVVCAKEVRFRLPEVQMGLIPGMGGTVSIPRRIGRGRTLWMLMTGEEVDASTAAEWGLVDEVVDMATLRQRVRDRAHRNVRTGKAGTA